jgi:hypothetical protein
MISPPESGPSVGPYISLCSFTWVVATQESFAELNFCPVGQFTHTPVASFTPFFGSAPQSTQLVSDDVLNPWPLFWHL